jgi:hypothetical protein
MANFLASLPLKKLSLDSTSADGRILAPQLPGASPSPLHDTPEDPPSSRSQWAERMAQDKTRAVHGGSHSSSSSRRQTPGNPGSKGARDQVDPVRMPLDRYCAAHYPTESAQVVTWGSPTPRPHHDEFHLPWKCGTEMPPMPSFSRFRAR